MKEHDPETLSIKTIIQNLSSHKEVMRNHYPAGQVLLYRDHITPGFFLLLKGAVLLSGDPSRPETLIEVDDQFASLSIPNHAVRERSLAPILLPPLQYLNLPFPHNVILQASAEFLFIPRSLANKADIQDMLQSLSSGLQSILHEKEPTATALDVHLAS